MPQADKGVMGDEYTLYAKSCDQKYADLIASFSKKIADDRMAAFEDGFKKGWEMARETVFSEMSLEQFREWAKVMLEYGYSGGKHE